MKKVLLISLTPCYPLFSGGALAQYYFLDGLKNELEFVYCTEVHSEIERQNLLLLKEKQPSLKIYSVNSYKPQAKNTIKKRLLSIFNLFQSLLGKKKEDLINLQADDFDDPYFWHVDHHYNPEFVTLINDVIEKENITQVQFDFYDTIDLCFAIPTDIRKIFIHHELRFRRLHLAFAKSHLADSYKHYLIKKTELFEKKCLREMDAVVVFNETDAELIKENCKHIIVSPFAIPEELIFKQKVSESFSHLLFVGGESHTPNKLGLMWFLDEIYLPNSQHISLPIKVVGDWSQVLKNRYKDYSQIVFCGVVDSMESYFENTILVNPILTGAGIRTKVLQAYVNKVPVISTSFGAEGCFDEDNKSHIALFYNATEFINILHQSNFKEMALNGFEYYNEFFNKESLLSIRKSIYS